MRKLWIFAPCVAIVFGPVSNEALTIQASSAAYADVVSAVNSANNGDTVRVPGGGATWSAAVNITKPITIIGAGQSGGTTITNSTHATSGLETPCFNIQVNQNARVEISDMHLIGTYNGNAGSTGIRIMSGSVLAKQIVIHDITFDGFSFGISNGNNGNAVIGGVVYDCTFNNVRITSRNSGFVNNSALHGMTVPSPAWGTDNYMVYEDNTINFTNWTGGYQGGNYCGDTEYPMNYIVRHCTYHINRMGAITVDAYDMHGNYGSAVNGMGFIIHDNTFWYTGPSVGVKLADIRGGVGSLIFNNRIHGQNGNYISVRADPAGSIFPTQSYTWNNVQDSGPMSNPLPAGPPSGYTEIAYPHPLRGAPGSTPTPTPVPTATPAPTPTPTPLGTSFNSTQGQISSPFAVNTDNSISQSVETIDPTEGGRAAYTFNVTDAGDYTMLSIVNCAGSDSDSFFVDIDGDDPIATMVWEVPVTSGFESRTVTWSGSTTPRFWSLAPGIHQLVIRGREAGAKIKSITLVARPAPPASPQILDGAGN